MNLTKTNVFGVILVAVAAILFALSFRPSIGHANPFYFSLSTGTSAATTTLNYMTVGTATTTETWKTIDASNQALNSAVLLMAIKASTTCPNGCIGFGTTTLSVRIEESMNGIDWAVATTSTLSTNIIEQVASGVVGSTSVVMRKITGIPTALQYIRAIVGVQPGSPNNAGIWMQFVGQREVR